MTRPTALAVALGGVLALAGCTDGGDEPVSTDDLPSEVVESGSHQAGIPTVTSCEDLNQAQERLTASADTDDGYRYWTYDLEDGTFVGIAVVEPGYPFADVDAALTSVADAVPECSDVTPLPELPEAAIGFTSTTSNSNGDRQGTTLLAPVGDDRIVTVAVSSEPGADPAVDAQQLLADVREKAADLDLS